MTPCWSVRVLSHAVTLAVTTFFVLPVAAQGRFVSLAAAGPELRPNAQHILEDALRTDGSAELQVVHTARSERIPVLPFSIARTGIALVDCRDAPPSAFVAVDVPSRLLPRMRRILRMESDDPPRI
jgi:hypothetical protein